MADRLDYAVLQKTMQSCGASFSDSWAAYENRELQRLKDFRHILPETVNAIIAERKKQYPEIHKLGTDLAVSDDRLQDMWQIYKNSLESADLQWVAFGHIGNNHIHVNILPRNSKELQKGLLLYEQFAAKAVQCQSRAVRRHGFGRARNWKNEDKIFRADVQPGSSEGNAGGQTGPGSGQHIKSR
jgi:D-lactate dehydrogenase (cytochrome)